MGASLWLRSPGGYLPCLNFLCSSENRPGKESKIRSTILLYCLILGLPL